MKTTIEVRDRKEGEMIRSGLQDETIRAFVIVMGVLKALPTDRSRERVLRFVKDKFDESDTPANPHD